MDEELWDILEDGVGNLRLDEEGVSLDRKAHTTEQKKLYKKHHLIRGILVASLPHKEYLEILMKILRLFKRWQCSPTNCNILLRRTRGS